MTTLSFAIIGIIVGLFVGIIIELIASLEDNVGSWKVSNVSWSKAITKGFAIGILSSIAVTSFSTVFSLDRVNERLKYESVYENTVTHISSMRDIRIRELFLKGLTDIDRRLNSISNNMLLIDRDEVFNYWEILFDISFGEVLATNVVSGEDWAFFGPDGAGTPVQKRAISENRVQSIKRVMLYDPQIPEHRKFKSRPRMLPFTGKKRNHPIKSYPHQGIVGSAMSPLDGTPIHMV